MEMIFRSSTTFTKITHAIHKTDTVKNNDLTLYPQPNPEQPCILTNFLMRGHHCIGSFPKWRLACLAWMYLGRTSNYHPVHHNPQLLPCYPEQGNVYPQRSHQPAPLGFNMYTIWLMCVFMCVCVCIYVPLCIWE